MNTTSAAAPWTLSAFTDEAGNGIDDQIKAARDAGLKYLDLRGVDGFNIAALPIENARAIKEKLDAANLQVQMFGSPLGKIDIADPFEPEADKLRHLTKLSPVLGCRRVRIFSYFNAHGATHEAWQAESLSRLSQLRDIARAEGLQLFHENERHIFGDLCDDVHKIARELRDADSFNLIFDFDNFNQSGEDVWATWQVLAPYTDSFHLKDSTAEKQHVPIGQGNGRLREILADAVAQNWSGPVAIEPHLQHSKAVAATGPSGQQNQQFAQLSEPEAFGIACRVAKEVLLEIKAPVA
jgi:sugar phosphate isomerase/epimerase